MEIFSCTKKNFFHSYAAKFRRFCPFCIYDAKVQIYLDMAKFFGN